MKLEFEAEYINLYVLPYICFVDWSWDDLDNEEWGIQIGWLYFGVYLYFGANKTNLDDPTNKI